METFSFETALTEMKKGYPVTRSCIKNDTVFIVYKKRIYQMSRSHGIRYPYIFTNKDLMAEDWRLSTEPMEHNNDGK